MIGGLGTLLVPPAGAASAIQPGAGKTARPHEDAKAACSQLAERGAGQVSPCCSRSPDCLEAAPSESGLAARYRCGVIQRRSRPMANEHDLPLEEYHRAGLEFTKGNPEDYKAL